jgi:hypothetical protein
MIQEILDFGFDEIDASFWSAQSAVFDQLIPA